MLSQYYLRRARLFAIPYKTNLLPKQLFKLSNRTEAVARLILNGRIYQRYIESKI